MVYYNMICDPQAPVLDEQHQVPNLVGEILNLGNGEDVRLVSVLKSGGFATVYLGQRRIPASVHPIECAVKAIPKVGEAKGLMRDRQEAFYHQLAYSTSRTNVVPILRHVETMEFIFMVMEYIKSGDLEENLHLYTDNDRLIKSVFLQLVDTVARLHSRSIYHRDLKPPNILVEDAGSRVLLTDFGLCTSLEYVFDDVGTKEYVPPECFYPLRRVHSPSRDIWALGLILVQLVSGVDLIWSSPTNDCNVYKDFLASSNWWYDTFPISEDLNKILRLLFVPDPQERITLPVLRRMIANISRFTRPQAKLRRSPELIQAWEQMKQQTSLEISRPTTVPIIYNPLIPIDAPGHSSMAVDALKAQQWLDLHLQPRTRNRDEGKPAVRSSESRYSSASVPRAPTPQPPQLTTEQIKEADGVVPKNPPKRYQWFRKLGKKK